METTPQLPGAWVTFRLVLVRFFFGFHFLGFFFFGAPRTRRRRATVSHGGRSTTTFQFVPESGSYQRQPPRHGEAFFLKLLIIRFFPHSHRNEKDPEHGKAKKKTLSFCFVSWTPGRAPSTSVFFSALNKVLFFSLETFSCRCPALKNRLIDCFFFFFVLLLQFIRNDRHETLCQQDPDCFTVIRDPRVDF